MRLKFWQSEKASVPPAQAAATPAAAAATTASRSAADCNSARQAGARKAGRYRYR